MNVTLSVSILPATSRQYFSRKISRHAGITFAGTARCADDARTNSHLLREIDGLRREFEVTLCSRLSQCVAPLNKLRNL